ncbi:hypothetical protein [Marinobacter sp. JSM 1782161]|uniref:hypothetical protein n=1 Tax=Marinobacter sp. JSM 1782161 TaxID=2685906 RepID=UPI0014022F52|nr:hypothetical protein [Marinobacter sp. JSM 1782161]
MQEAPEILYLVPGETWDSKEGLCWCDCPAPSEGMDPADATKYVREDVYQALESHLVAMREALNDQLNDCINFDGWKLTNSIMRSSREALDSTQLTADRAVAEIKLSLLRAIQIEIGIKCDTDPSEVIRERIQQLRGGGE